MTEEEIRETINNNTVDWNRIIWYQTLSEEFIREFQDRVNWSDISFKQTLSEEFIKEFKDKVYWKWISFCQTLSEEFILEFIDKVELKTILEKYSDSLSEEALIIIRLYTI